MSTSSRFLLCASITLIGVSIAGCTSGRVTENGVPVQSATLKMQTCPDLPIDLPGSKFTATTTTDSGGRFLFNPFSPSTPDFDESKAIPAQPILITIEHPSGTDDEHSWRLIVDHEYSTTCDIPYGGSVNSLPCEDYQIDVGDIDPSYEISSYTQEYFVNSTCYVDAWD